MSANEVDDRCRHKNRVREDVEILKQEVKYKMELILELENSLKTQSGYFYENYVEEGIEQLVDWLSHKEPYQKIYTTTKRRKYSCGCVMEIYEINDNKPFDSKNGETSPRYDIPFFPDPTKKN